VPWSTSYGTPAQQYPPTWPAAPAPRGRLVSSTGPFLVGIVGGLTLLVGALGQWYELTLSVGSNGLSTAGSGLQISASATGGWLSVIPIGAVVVVVLLVAAPMVRPYPGWPSGFGWLVRLVSVATLAAVVASLLSRTVQGGSLSALAALGAHVHTTLSWGAWVGLAGATVMTAAALVAGTEHRPHPLAA